MASSSGNLLDKLAELLAERIPEASVALIPSHRPNQQGDVIVVDRSGSSTALADVCATWTGQFVIRCDDDELEALGRALEAEDASALDVTDLAADKAYVLCYLDPNATKALHVGHLRNLAVGHGVAATLRAAGADVVEQCHICDMGRAMGEALAGYVTFGNGQTPADVGVKPDHFVGERYRRYVAAIEDQLEHDDARDPALSREDGAGDDLAVKLMERLSLGAADVERLWTRLRGWVLEGHQHTLARLGVRFDRMFLESDYEAEIVRLRDLVLAQKVGTRLDSGAVAYLTGRENYPTLLLARPDGGATQHLRYLALWWATRPLLQGTHSIQVAGDEWKPLTIYGDEVLRAVSDDETHPTTCVLHGMVTIGGSQVKSSRGEPLLIDDLLDLLAARPEVMSLAGAHARVDADRLVVAAALGLVLASPPSKRVDVSIEDFTSPKAGAGWVLARGWAKAWDPRYDGPPDPAVDDVDYRFLVVQSQVHRALVQRALDRLEVEPLMRFHVHLNRWFLTATDDPRLARMMRTILAAAGDALGLPLGSPADEVHQAGLEPAAVGLEGRSSSQLRYWCNV